jgi:GTP-binding protein
MVSAAKRSGLNNILPTALRIQQEGAMRAPTGQLNRAMEETLRAHQPPVVKRARAKFFYLTQAESNPPTFVFFVSDAERVPDSYVRYLEKSLRRLLGIRHAPLRVRLRSSHKKA